MASSPAFSQHPVRAIARYFFGGGTTAPGGGTAGAGGTVSGGDGEGCAAGAPLEGADAGVELPDAAAVVVVADFVTCAGRRCAAALRSRCI